MSQLITSLPFPNYHTEGTSHISQPHSSQARCPHACFPSKVEADTSPPKASNRHDTVDEDSPAAAYAYPPEPLAPSCTTRSFTYYLSPPHRHQPAVRISAGLDPTRCCSRRAASFFPLRSVTPCFRPWGNSVDGGDIPLRRHVVNSQRHHGLALAPLATRNVNPI